MDIPLTVHQVNEDPVKSRETELVERKGIGHPDSICDGIAESISRKLSKEYIERFGKILHHNTDEAQLVAGNSKPEFGGGEVVEPIHILLTGRATKEFDGEEIPVERLALEAAEEYIDENLQVLESDMVEFECRIGETSTDLKEVFEDEKPKSNDTSFGVGHSSLSPVEKTVKKVESSVRNDVHEAGDDIKVMALRDGEVLKLTVAAAIISERVQNEEDYMEAVEKVESVARSVAEEKTDLEVEVHVNTADEPENESFYITETGTSAEMGDDGSVGRGNRVNGVITPHRSMSMEAASGKNPRTHVGKVYNLLADRIANEIHEETGEFADVKLLSQIGAPIDEPQKVEVETAASGEEVEEVVEDCFESIEEVTESCVKGEVSTF